MILQLLSVLSLLGTWQYVGFHYEGRFYPNPNKNLVVRFLFDERNISHLKWYRENESGFCERQAEYSLNGDTLWQKVIWVHPNNDFSCAKDPDMQIGSETQTKVIMKDHLLGLVLSLKGEDFIYLLEKKEDEKRVEALGF